MTKIKIQLLFTDLQPDKRVHPSTQLLIAKFARVVILFILHMC